jgi:poly(3-hydroxybutyrate) depolymerase
MTGSSSTAARSGENRFRAALAAARLGVLLLAALPLRADSDWRAWEVARVRLHVARIELLERIDRNAYPYIYRDLSDASARENAAISDALRSLAGNAAPAPLRGVRIDAYVSPVDDSAQPFVRYLPPNWAPGKAAPLLVYLHGYSPDYDRFNLPFFPETLTRVADRTGACIAAPFGRGNTDFQGIGEQDVLRVMDEMQARYSTDPNRVVLVGYSMGGLGAWCIAARHPQRFNAMMALAGRGDFYVWHKLKPEELPPWQRRLVDTQFASAWAHQLKNTPILAVHGQNDSLVSFVEGRAIFDTVAPHNPNARFIADPVGDHGAPLEILTNAVGAAWLEGNLTVTNARASVSGVRTGETGSRLQNALQQPFVLVGGTDSLSDVEAQRRLNACADEWLRFAHGKPRAVLEPLLSARQADALNLFVLGEPESSPLIRRIFERNGVSCTAETFRIGARVFPRAGHGLWFTAASPFNTNRTAVVQCGIPWGAALPDNHRYDRIPDVMVYTPEADFYGANLAVAAGFVGADGTIAWSEPATTPAIKPKPVLYDFDETE